MSVMTSDQPDLMQQRAFILKRLHSLSGIVPVGAFLAFHLLANFTILFGAEAYNTVVAGIHLLDKIHLLFVVEMLFIIFPILFHGLFGIYIWWSGNPDLRSYPNGSNLCYVLQRITGGLVFAFILFHLYHMSWFQDKFFGEEGEETRDMALRVTTAMREHGWVVPVYVLGITGAAFHLSNGLRTALITWGVTITHSSQKLASRFSAVIGIGLALVGLTSLVVFLRG